MNCNIRKIVTYIEECRKDGTKEVNPPVRKCVVSAVIENPFSGKYEENLSYFYDVGEYLGDYLAQKCLEALGISPDQAHSYGKGAIVGADGELEHAAAILHPKLGAPFRLAIGGGKSIIPSAKKLGGPGTTLDVPLHYKDAAYVRSHYDAVEARIPDAPRGNEIVVSLALTDSGRPHPRIGGLSLDEVEGIDGLR